MNGWGTVGLWPGVRIYSIRALPSGADSFPFSDYRRAILTCSKHSDLSRGGVVNLSLGCNCAYSEEQRTAFEDVVTDAHRYGSGLDVVAAAGNHGASIGMPAAATGVFSVGAGDGSGHLCAYSNRGPDLDLIAPGCAIDGAWPDTGQPFIGWSGGTSPAAAAASAALALLRSFRPDLTWAAAERILLDSGRAGDAVRTLDIESAFRAAGLGTLVDAARARMSAEPTAEAPDAASDASLEATHVDPSVRVAAPPQLDVSLGAQGRARLRAPVVARLIRHGRLLIVEVRQRPSRGRLAVSVQAGGAEFGYRTRVTRTTRARIVAIPVPRHLVRGRVLIRYEAGRGTRGTSPTVYAAIPR
jgi:Subtilase family